MDQEVKRYSQNMQRLVQHSFYIYLQVLLLRSLSEFNCVLFVVVVGTQILHLPHIMQAHTNGIVGEGEPYDADDTTQDATWYRTRRIYVSLISKTCKINAN